MATILLIEDKLEIRENTAAMLELAGYSVMSAVNGIAGIELAKEKLPDIILCDIVMPETNGFEVFNQLRRDDATLGIPFILVTASAEKKEVQAGMAIGADDYLGKPFEQEELFNVIEHCLNKD